jgi:4-amino-4-deoxychorismate mutase
MSRSTSPTADDLQALRERLDDVDRLLLETLRRRIDCCRNIADVKRRLGVPMMQPHRIDVVQNRAARYAAENDVDGDFLRRLYDLIIEETCRVEALVMGAVNSHANASDR